MDTTETTPPSEELCYTCEHRRGLHVEDEDEPACSKCFRQSHDEGWYGEDDRRDFIFHDFRGQPDPEPGR